MSLGFNTALSALTAARVALQTVGHNIANAGTEGYTRQRVLMSPFLPQAFGQGLAIGRGVGIDAIDQIYDPLLTGRLRLQTQEVGRAQGQFDVYQDLESALGGAGPSGLSARLGDFFASLGSLQATPGDAAGRTAALQSAVTLAQTFRTIRGDMQGVAESVDAAIRYEIGDINATLDEIAQINKAILTNGFGGALPPDLHDRQNVLVAKLAQSIDVRVTREPTGQITVISAGHALVDPNGFNEVRMTPKQLTGESVKLRAGSTTAEFKPKSGRLSSLLEMAPNVAAERVKAFDALARGLIQAVNHAHATGVPPAGGYTSLAALHAFQDVDLDGNILNERLDSVGLPFDVKAGKLTVSVTDANGNVNQTRIAVDPGQSVESFVTALNGIAHVTASVDSTGRLRIVADGGYKFDFSARLNPTPDAAGTFGGAQATIVTGLSFPANIPPGLQFQIAVDGAPAQTVTFLASHFQNPAAASAEEVAAAINAQVTGATASVVSGKLVVQSNTTGSSSSLQVNGSPVSFGSDDPVSVKVSGAYTGAADESFIVTPLNDGVVGQTPGLKIEIRTAGGTVVDVVDVGDGYEAGTPIRLRDGIEIAIGTGALSATSGHFVQIDAVAESDEAGVLVATGLAGVFDGYDAATIEVRPDLLANPSLLATGLGGGANDGSNLARLLASQERKIESLAERTVAEGFDALIQEVGSNTQRARSTLETQQLLRDQLEARRQATSGVNLDEELLLMEQYRQSFEMAARYSQTLQEVTASLMELVR